MDIHLWSVDGKAEIVIFKNIFFIFRVL